MELADELFPDPEPDVAVPFVPTDDRVVAAMLELAGVNEQDLLYDLGCGDGRIVVAAARDRRARAVGIDLDAGLLEEAREYAGWTGVEHLVDFIEDDIFCAEFRDATVVTMYLLRTINLELRPRLLRGLKPGTRIVSHDFDMGDWPPDEKIDAGGAKVFLWLVPAPVAGTWRWQAADGRSFQVELKQRFQKLSGQAWVDGQPDEMRSATPRRTRLRLPIRAPGAARAETFVARYNDGFLVPVPSKRSGATLAPWEKLDGGA